jgi:hypothetical protein
VANALHQQCVDGVVTILKALSLDGIGQNVVSQLLEDTGNLTYPYLRVSIEGEAEQVRGWTSGARLWVLPVRVEQVDRIAGPATEAMPGWTDWRQKVFDAFPNKRQSVLPAEVWGCEVQPEASIRNERAAYQKASGAMVLRFRATRAV